MKSELEVGCYAKHVSKIDGNVTHGVVKSINGDVVTLQVKVGYELSSNKSEFTRLEMIS